MGVKNKKTAKQLKHTCYGTLCCLLLLLSSFGVQSLAMGSGGFDRMAGGEAGEDPQNTASETLDIFYYEQILQTDPNGSEGERVLRVFSATPLIPLSIRINGLECEWEQSDTCLYLWLPQKAGTVYIEALFLYEAGKNCPQIILGPE